MNFFRDKKKIKVSIEDYVASWRAAYSTEGLLLWQEICSDSGIQLLKNEYTWNAWAFKFEDGLRGIVYNPTLPRSPLLYHLAKKTSHHLLGHFEREPPMYLVETEAHYFAAAAVGVRFITLRCIDAPPWLSLLASPEKIKRTLASYYSRTDTPVLL